MFKEAYYEVEGEAAEALLEKINEVSDLSDFEADKTRILTHPLAYYPGYHMLKIADEVSFPAKKLRLIYKGDDFIVIDGTSRPFSLLNEKNALVLNNDNVISYVKLYFFAVKAPEGAFILVDAPDDIPWKEEPNNEARRAIFKLIEPLSVIKPFDAKQGATLKGSIFFKNALFETDIHVSAEGHLSMSNQELLIDDLPAAESL